MTPADTWTLSSALAWTARHLAEKGVESARLEAERMLTAATGLSRVELYAYHDRVLSEPERVAYRHAIERRVAGEPLQYVVGEVAFRRIVLKVGPGVFIPRPETEVLVEAVLEAVGSGAFGVAVAAAAARDTPIRVLDLCTGSGAVALSLARELPRARVVAVDSSEEACRCARGNAERLALGGSVEVRQGDLYEALAPGELFEAVVANPPYVPSAAVEGLDPVVRDHEPREALDGGAAGLDTILRIVRGAPGRLVAGGVLALEVDASHAHDVASAARDAGSAEVRVLSDLSDRPRVVVARRVA